MTTYRIDSEDGTEVACGIQTASSAPVLVLTGYGQACRDTLPPVRVAQTGHRIPEAAHRFARALGSPAVVRVLRVCQSLRVSWSHGELCVSSGHATLATAPLPRESVPCLTSWGLRRWLADALAGEVRQ